MHRSPYHGFSVEFSEYRQYTPGRRPAVSRLAAFARTDRYYVKRFEDETNLRCYLLVDLSRSMGYGSAGVHQERLRPHRWRRRSPISCHRSATRSGWSRSTSEIAEYLPPRHRPGHLRRLMALLRARAARPRDRPGRAARADRRRRCASAGWSC